MKKLALLFYILLSPILFGAGILNESANHSLPSNLVFAGQKVPTEYWFVMEELNDLLLTMQANPSVVCKYVRRSILYESLIKDKLRQAGLPEDLFYIAVIESALSPTAKSRAAAVGMWQFMRYTGRIYELRDNGPIDERKVIEKATDAAIAHFKDLYNEFQDWFLAAAAYNAGAGRVREMIKKYNKKNYWLIKFPKEETNQYMYRAVVIKEVMQNLGKYGFPKDECLKCFQPEVKFYKKRFLKTKSLIKLSEELGMEYMEFIKLNPAYGHRDSVPAGIYYFLILVDIKEK
jgi:membrane-bound lytic murein transglycosylase D